MLSDTATKDVFKPLMLADSTPFVLLVMIPEIEAVWHTATLPVKTKINPNNIL